MTYLIGWKTETSVFLAADSALTSRRGLSLDVNFSSFGEEHLNDGQRIVEERMPKMLMKNNIGAAFAGTVSLATDIIYTFFNEIDNGKQPLEALKWAVGICNPTPLDDRSAVVLVAYTENAHPYLLSFNANHDHVIKEEHALVQAGSMPQNYKNFTEYSLSQILPNTVFEPDKHLASMLGIFQTYGVIDDLLAHGVGGAFSGLWIDDVGGHWQPDILYKLDDKLVSTCFREDCFLIGSPTIGQSRCLIAYIPPKSQSELLAQGQAGIAQAKDIQRNAKFDYVVMVNKKNSTIVLVEMKGNNRHELLWLDSFEREGRTGTSLVLFPLLQHIFEDDVFFRSIPYLPPTIDLIPKDQIKVFKIDNESS